MFGLTQSILLVIETYQGGDEMKLATIGKNVRKYRLMKKLRQEDLAEKAGLTTNYIGMVERGEKIPSLETFINILNALGVSADMVLSEVLNTGYTVKNSMLNEKLEKLTPEDRDRIYEVLDTLIKQSYLLLISLLIILFVMETRLVVIGGLFSFCVKKYAQSTRISRLRQLHCAITITTSDRQQLIITEDNKNERHFRKSC